MKALYRLNVNFYKSQKPARRGVLKAPLVKSLLFTFSLFLSSAVYSYVGSVDNSLDQKAQACEYSTESRANKSAGSRDINPENVLANLLPEERSDESRPGDGSGGAIQ